MKNILALGLSCALALPASAPTLAQDLAPDALVKSVTLEVVELIAKDKEIKAGSRGKLVSVIDRRYPLAEAAEAIRYLETGRARGKVVVTMN